MCRFAFRGVSNYNQNPFNKKNADLRPSFTFSAKIGGDIEVDDFGALDFASLSVSCRILFFVNGRWMFAVRESRLFRYALH